MAVYRQTITVGLRPKTQKITVGQPKELKVLDLGARSPGINIRSIHLFFLQKLIHTEQIALSSNDHV